MIKRILVIGTARFYDNNTKSLAFDLGVNLARSGFGLIVGNWPGVDAEVASGFAAELRASNQFGPTHFTQLYHRPWSRWLQGRGPRFQAPDDCIKRISSDQEWIESAIAHCDAVVMIGGGKQTLLLARRFINAEKPIFPLPFTGGQSDSLFQELLKDCHARPIPGLTKGQVLGLALPWTEGAGPLVQLIQGTLAEQPDIFISYRRADSSSVAGRIYRELADHFGTNRVFIDGAGIEPSAEWQQSINAALRSCKVGIIVIGKYWLDSRLVDENDPLRREVAFLLENSKSVPLLVDGTAVPNAIELPMELRALPDIQVHSINNASWDSSMHKLVKIIQRRMAEKEGRA